MRYLNAALMIVALAVFGPVSTGLAEEAKSLPMVQGQIKKVDVSAGKMTIKHAAISKPRHGWHDHGVQSTRPRDAVASEARRQSHVFR